MSIVNALASERTTRSLEFYPPKTERGRVLLSKRIEQFYLLKPDFVSVTYGAGGSTRELTHSLVSQLAADGRVEVTPHLTCVCHTRSQVNHMLREYAALGITGIMALGGDPPQRKTEACSSDYTYASQLVDHIREFNREQTHPNGGFTVGVAGFPEGHPATPNRVSELDYLKRKVDAGADYICTQLFFDNRDFFDFRERCAIAGIHIPIVAGIMPISTIANVERVPGLALGSRYPAPLLRRLIGLERDDDIYEVGLEWSIMQCQELIDQGVSGIHFYSLNQFEPIRTLWETIFE
ncbi:MAG: methylenetetrahydrofolate reductase [Spirochaetota bacterium]